MDKIVFRNYSKDKIQKSFSELKKYGFYLRNEISQDDNYIIIYQNKFVILQINISMLQFKELNILGSFFLRITNISNEDWFNIRDFFTQYKGLDYKDVPFVQNIYFSDNIEQQIDAYLSSVIKILQTELIEIITGVKWVHIPMDYCGAK